jgi:hypothetical protein
VSEPIRQPHILIVEDTLGIARSLSLGLGLYQRDAYQAEVCGSGEEALRRLLETPIDLLITDLRLPGISGLTLLERTRHFSPATRSILITAYSSPEVEQQAQALADAYITKPFLLQDVLSQVERILQQPPKRPTPITAPVRPMAGIAEQIEQRRSVHLTVFACDFDGTLADEGQVDPATWDALRAARMAGMVHILVTGRALDSIIGSGPFEELFEAIVAENGAVVQLTRRNKVALPFGALDARLVQQWHAMDLPMEWGLAIAATVKPHDEVLLRTLRTSRACATVVYNRNAAMFLPPGATKGSGLLYALEELGYSAHNVLACGDAENDRSLFEVAEMGVAVANATPDLRSAADVVLAEPAGAGVRRLLHDLLAGKPPVHRPRPERALVLGQRSSGSPVRLDPYAVIESNMGILGCSGSGKSWLAGLVTEELLKQKYQVCIIDPEGDYRALAASPRTLLLGGPETPLPSVASVLNVAEWNNVSLVLDLSMYEVERRHAYLGDFLRALRGLRARRGRPHFFLIDEVQSFCPSEGGELTDLLQEAMQWGGFGLVSYRPSLVARPLLERLDQLLLTRLALPEEISTVAPWLRRYKGSGEVLDALPTLLRGQAFLCTGLRPNGAANRSALVRFQVGGRAIPHIRHLHKYLRTPLPEPKRFYFRTREGKPLGTAASLWEFRERIVDLPADSLLYHAERGDFTAWCSGVLHDEELARRISKIADRQLSRDAMRHALLKTVTERYEELEMLV